MGTHSKGVLKKIHLTVGQIPVETINSVKFYHECITF